MLPQVFSEALGGTVHPETSIASTTQMFDIQSETWATGLLEDLGLPTDLLGDLRDPGAVVGELDDEYAASLSGRPDVVLTTTHDTASAVAGIPFEEPPRTFLSTGPGSVGPGRHNAVSYFDLDQKSTVFGRPSPAVGPDGSGSGPPLSRVEGPDYRTVYPPSMMTRSPVTYSEASEAR
ncbi:hypothetical protein BRC83_06445 [Halobacteriales archaeon QS_1_68_17]|nr:MAG: hypothetical protein BRC83_06445 [Halobacteriales archaeon QS_1_68_17]